MLALCFSTLLEKCLIKLLGWSALWLMVGNIAGGCLFECALTTGCSSLPEDARAIPYVYNLHLAVCTSS